MSKQLFLEQNQREGESYAGIILGENGAPDYHLFELPRIPGEKYNFDAAMKRAKLLTGEFEILVANRDENQLIRINSANSSGAIGWHWTSEKLAVNTDYAWVQGFNTGTQCCYHKSNEFSAAFVRRIYIQE